MGTAPSAGMEMDIIVESTCTVKEVRKKCSCHLQHVPMINVCILLCVLSYYLQCLKTMLDAVGLDGKITFFGFVHMYCRLILLFLLLQDCNQSYLLLCISVQYLVVNVS